MNKVVLIGRVTQDLELRATGTGKDIVSYQLAVRRDKDNTDFINLVTFGEFAKILCQYCKKGDMIGIEGKLQINSYEDKEGKKRTSYNVITEKIEFLQTKREDKESGKPVEKVYSDEIIVEDSELPF